MNDFSRIEAQLDGASDAPEPSLEITIAELAKVSAIEYDQCREDVAKRHGIRVSTLDSEVAKLREPEKSEDKPDGGFKVEEPWPDAVETGELFEMIISTVERFCVLPRHSAPLVAGWIMHAWAHDAFDISPVLAVTSPEKRCGKSTCLKLVAALSPKAMHSVNISASVLFRVIELHKPTVLIDEADTFLAEREEMRGMLNGGHDRQTAFVWRSVGDNHDPTQFNVWAPKAVAMIGELPGTLEDRSLVVPLRRKDENEVTERFHIRRADELRPIRQMLARWSQDHIDELAEAEPVLPDALDDRAQDNARCICAIADLAGGTLKDTIRTGLVELADSRRKDAPASRGVTLLRDVADILERWKGDRITSADLVAELCAIEDGPWEVWAGGQPITARMIASLLKPFDVRPTRTTTQRFYAVTDLRDAVQRYAQ